MTYESRVLAVLMASEHMGQGQVIKAAKMDTHNCISALRRLEDLGVIERTTYRGGRSGRPTYLYRRVAA